MIKLDLRDKLFTSLFTIGVFTILYSTYQVIGVVGETKILSLVYDLKELLTNSIG
ncbi:MAG: hypothetical protein ACI9U0_000810 [Flavobacteriales bacterium]|jgi:hypothetical protein|tara:strand:+ start:636 stop:800 length:165 start_codon:yes stop_codon:yes gene_type:complete